jgi:hypothetical protein
MMGYGEQKMTQFRELMGYRAVRARAKTGVESNRYRVSWELPPEIRRISKKTGPWYSETYTGPAARGFYAGLADGFLEISLNIAKEGNESNWSIARDTFSHSRTLYEDYAGVLHSRHAQRKLTQYARAGPFYWEKAVLQVISGAPGFGTVALLERLRGEKNSAAGEAYADLLDMIQGPAVPVKRSKKPSS